MLKLETPSDTMRSPMHSAHHLNSRSLDLAPSRKREASPDKRVHEPPSKRQTKWSEEEDELVTMLRADGMKWEDIAKRVRGRSSISCRLHYQNFLEKKARWDEERKNKLARLYERFKQSMWEPVAKELKMPWRACEDMHWKMGKQQMADRAGANVFTSIDPTQPRDSSAGPSGHYMLSGPLVPVQHFSPLSSPPAPAGQSYQPTPYGPSQSQGPPYPGGPLGAHQHYQQHQHQTYPPPNGPSDWNPQGSPQDGSLPRTTHWPPLTYPSRRPSQTSETLEPMVRQREASNTDRWSSSRQSRSMSVGYHAHESRRNLPLLYDDRPQLPPLRLTLPVDDSNRAGSSPHESSLADAPPHWRSAHRPLEAPNHSLPPFGAGPILAPAHARPQRAPYPTSASPPKST